ncbi:MAG: Lrp/AsnC ligand binding domain-containing protein [Kordiimonadaceae bacterium]|nr:Lrp/AsnC ligand binding domain-containing protein [Kordiimonadaceae bacterium]
MNRAVKYEKIINSMPEVIECEAVLGNIDYSLKILSRNVEDYQQIIDRLHEMEDFELDYRSFPVSRVIKEANQANVLEIYETFVRKL